MIHTVKGFGTVIKAEVDVFLELSCFFNDTADVGNLVSGSSAFSKSNLNIWKFTVHVLLNLGEFWGLLCQCVRWVQLCSSLSILWHCLSVGLKWKLTFSSPVATAEFSKFAGILSAALSQHPHISWLLGSILKANMKEISKLQYPLFYNWVSNSHVKSLGLPCKLDCPKNKTHVDQC